MTQQSTKYLTDLDLMALRSALVKARDTGSRHDSIWEINAILTALPKPKTQGLLTEDELHAHVVATFYDDPLGPTEHAAIRGTIHALIEDGFLELP